MNIVDKIIEALRPFAAINLNTAEIPTNLARLVWNARAALAEHGTHKNRWSATLDADGHPQHGADINTVDMIMTLADGYARGAILESTTWISPPASIAARKALRTAIVKAMDQGEPVAWIDSNGPPHHLSELRGVRGKQLYGA